MGSKITKEKRFELDEYDIKYLLDTTNFTREQIEEWHSGFIVIIKISNWLIAIIYFLWLDLTWKVKSSLKKSKIKIARPLIVEVLFFKYNFLTSIHALL